MLLFSKKVALRGISGSGMRLLIRSLSHNRNSKGFDHTKSDAPVWWHDEISIAENSWAHCCAGIERERFGANDDQRRRRDLSVSDLLKMVR